MAAPGAVSAGEQGLSECGSRQEQQAMACAFPWDAHPPRSWEAPPGSAPQEFQYPVALAGGDPAPVAYATNFPPAYLANISQLSVDAGIADGRGLSDPDLFGAAAAPAGPGERTHTGGEFPPFSGERPPHRRQHQPAAAALPQMIAVVERASQNPIAPTRCRKTKRNHVKRPLNRFFIFRLEMQALYTARYPGANNREISKMIAEQWKLQPSDVKTHYGQLAELAKRKHAEMYPNYKYQPSKSRRPSSNAGADEGMSDSAEGSEKGSENRPARCGSGGGGGSGCGEGIGGSEAAGDTAPATAAGRRPSAAATAHPLVLEAEAELERGRTGAAGAELERRFPQSIAVRTVNDDVTHSCGTMNPGEAQSQMFDSENLDQLILDLLALPAAGSRLPGSAGTAGIADGKAVPGPDAGETGIMQLLGNGAAGSGGKYGIEAERASGGRPARMGDLAAAIHAPSGDVAATGRGTVETPDVATADSARSSRSHSEDLEDVEAQICGLREKLARLEDRRQCQQRQRRLRDRQHIFDPSLAKTLPPPAREPDHPMPQPPAGAAARSHAAKRRHGAGPANRAPEFPEQAAWDSGGGCAYAWTEMEFPAPALRPNLPCGARGFAPGYFLSPFDPHRASLFGDLPMSGMYPGNGPLPRNGGGVSGGPEYARLKAWQNEMMRPAYTAGPSNARCAAVARTAPTPAPAAAPETGAAGPAAAAPVESSAAADRARRPTDSAASGSGGPGRRRKSHTIPRAACPPAAIAGGEISSQVQISLQPGCPV